MKKLIKLFLIINFVIASFFISITAQTTNDPNTATTLIPTTSVTATVTSISTQKIIGKVTKVDGSNITIQDDSNNTKVLSIPNNVTVTRDGNSGAKVADIKLNDSLTATVDSNNSIVSVDDTSDKSSLVALIPILVIGIIVIALAAYLISKSNKGKIRTSVEQVN